MDSEIKNLYVTSSHSGDNATKGAGVEMTVFSSERVEKHGSRGGVGGGLRASFSKTQSRTSRNRNGVRGEQRPRSVRQRAIEGLAVGAGRSGRGMDVRGERGGGGRGKNKKHGYKTRRETPRR